MPTKFTDISHACEWCGNEFFLRSNAHQNPNGGRFCSNRCAAIWKHRDPRSPHFKVKCVMALLPHPADPTALLVPLDKGLFAVIDAEDAHIAERHSWTSTLPTPRGVIYARSALWGSHESLHRAIMGEPDGVIDHKDDDGLNCRRSNLRVTTHQMNIANSRKTNRSSGYRGVYPTHNRRQRVVRWQVWVHKRYVGTFETKEEAARAYDKAAIEEFGEFARLNFPDEVAA